MEFPGTGWWLIEASTMTKIRLSSFRVDNVSNETSNPGTYHSPIDSFGSAKAYYAIPIYDARSHKAAQSFTAGVFREDLSSLRRSFEIARAYN